MKPKANYKPGPMDNCQTPAYALAPLLTYLPQNVTVWESAVGEGYLANALREAGYGSVIGTDILSGIDFFEYEPLGAYIQVTNPPYGRKYHWLKRSYALGKPFALLLPVETLGAKTAQELFRQSPPEVVFLNGRVNFKMPNKGWNGQAQFPVCWITWQFGIGRQMTFAKLPERIAQ